MKNTNIISERLVLRKIQDIDLDKVHALHSIEEVDKFNTLGIPKDKSETEVILENWVLENNKENTTKFTFAVELKKEQEFIGIIGLNLGKVKYKNAEVWFKFDPEFWNKGYATESLNQILDFGFRDLNLHRIEAGCAIGNMGSIKVLEKVGMLREAHTRKLLPLKSGWSDNFGYAKLASD